MHLRDVRYAFRSLRKSPGFVAVAVLSLGLGLGLSTTMFALLDAVTHPYVPYRDPERLFSVVGWFPTRRVSIPSFEVYRAVRDFSRSFESVVPVAGETGAVEIGGEGVEIGITRVPANYFAVLGVTPRLGRVFQQGDSARDVAVIGYEAWRQRFSGRRSLEGLSVAVSGRPYAVVGVMPKGMSGGIWLPMSAELMRLLASGVGHVSIVARLKTGVTPDVAKGDLDAVGRHLTELYHSPDAPFGFQLFSRRPDPMGLKDIHWAMLGASLAVLLIACANLANLTLARGLAKRREIALRLAVGASRAAVVWQMFAECIVLSVGGVILGAAFGVWGVGILNSRVPHDLWWLGIVRPQLSWRVFALAAVAAVGAAVVFGLIPAIRVANAVSLDEPLKDGAGTTGRTRRRYSALAISEVGLALVLLMGAGLLIRVVHRLASYQFDFPARLLVQAYVYPARQDTATTPGIGLGAQAALEAARAVPGVVDVAGEGGLMLPGGAVTAELTGDSTRTFSGITVVTPNYLRTMGLHVVEGRDFMEGDVSGNGAVILNAAAAARLYPRQQAVGRMLKLGGPASNAPWVRVVGVCGTVASSRPGEQGFPVPQVLLARPVVGRGVRLVIRTAREDPQIAVAVRRRLRSLAPRDYISVYPYLIWLETDLHSRGFLAQLFVTMGSFALILAAVGIYGVLAYAVNRRLREFAVRVALGAQRSDLVKAVLHDGLVMTLAGTGLGGFAALWSSYLFESFLEDIYPTDALTLLVAEAVLIAVTIAACLAPALRAMRADPIEILRAT
jgi:predicted permease